jgi:hypothetical protein
MSHALITSPDRTLDRLQSLATRGAALYERALAEPMTARDLALAIDLNQQYVDILAELEDADLTVRPVTANPGGALVEFTDIDGLADWLAGAME